MPDIAELGRKVKAKYPGQYDDLDDGEVGRRVRVKYPGAYDDFTDTPPATVLPQDRQTFGRRPATLDESLTQSARANRGRPQPSKVDMDTMTINPEGVRRAKQEAFERKPITEQIKERATDALTRGGGQVSRMARQTMAAIGRLAPGNPSLKALEPWQQAEEGKFRTLEQRRRSRPSSFATDTAEGILEALPAASIATLAGMATGGSLPVAMATGAGMGAAGADWNDPRRAAAQTALGAVAPVVGGKVGQSIGGAVAARLTRPVAQGAARAGGEIVGGGAGNVIGSGAEQLAFEGRLNPRELARQGIIGGALNVPGAVSAGRRRGAITEPLPETEQIPAAQPVVALQQPEALPTVTPPRVRSPRQTVEMPRVQARVTPPEVSRQTAEIPRVPTAPTQRIPTAPKPVYPDAPETQEMPEIRARIAAENATTKELPQPVEQPSPQVLKTQAPVPVVTRPRTERLPVGKATDESIKGLRDRREQLSRLEATRRGEFPPDLADEFRELGAVIRDYENQRAPREFAPPPGRPERMTVPPEEKAARREVLSGRKIQHSTLGLVTESANQKGVPKGKMRVVKEDGGTEHFIQNPRTRGNREASFVRSIPDEAMPELQMPNAPKAPQAGRDRPVSPIDYTIPAEAMPELRGKAQPNIVQKMASLARTPSSPVEIAKLRAEFPGMSKADFDGQMAKLNEEGRIALQRHDHPASLKEADRANMVQIGKDYFTAATFRERPGQVMGMGLGGLQGMFKDRPKTPEPGQQPLFDSEPKRSLAKRAASNVVSAATLPRALMASADLSAPLRQGAILTLPPTQWGRAAKSGVRMIQALKTSKYKSLVDEMNAHPDAKVGKDAGLYMATDPKKGSSLQGREEDFISKWAEKIPIVKHSEQAYKTYLDSIRLETFRKYKRVIDGDKKLSFEDKYKAYKAAADWINVASGRGSLGKTLDKAMPALSTVFFAPRYTASRVQVLNPATYLKNSATPAGRAVLKQQMTDLVQFAGMVSATLALAKAAGAEVGTDPEDADFLKIKVGNVRYDTLAGLQQVMRLFYRTGKDVGRATLGKEPEEGEGALKIAGKFVRSKLAPVPSFFTDFLSRKDFIGRDFEVGRGVKERMIPLMWKDFYDAYQREGIGGAAKLTPGAFGLGVQDFAKKPGVLTQKNEAYTGELKRLGVKPAESARRLENEPEDLFKGRTGKIESWRDQYGAQLIQHPMYQRLSDEQKKAAIESLHQRISQQANEKRPNLSAFRPATIARGVREGERSRRRTDRDKIYVAPR